MKEMNDQDVAIPDEGMSKAKIVCFFVFRRVSGMFPREVGRYFRVELLGLAQVLFQTIEMWPLE
ncbi:hypothetical protein [uncultured Methanofollis sp.]|uniref:hypothetical protein n=1 Tax=uncultured Methanofollis sp. TaxID=262500 RepID=UPI00262BBFB5|nr:hypothetical protein [uncultured Methanofollis sp.]